MKILTRYLLRSHLGPFCFAFAALFAVVLTNVVAEQLAELAGKGLPRRVFVEFFVLSLPSNVGWLPRLRRARLSPRPPATG